MIDVRKFKDLPFCLQTEIRKMTKISSYFLVGRSSVSRANVSIGFGLAPRCLPDIEDRLVSRINQPINETRSHPTNFRPCVSVDAFPVRGSNSCQVRFHGPRRESTQVVPSETTRWNLSRRVTTG